MTIEGVDASEFERFFEVTVREPDPLKIYSGLTNKRNNLTMTMKGGNTEELYNINKTGDQNSREGNADFDNRREFAESLRRQHPDEVRVTWKWGRWHHHIDYSQFQHTPPTLKSGLNIRKGHTNEYGLKLVKLKPEVEYG